MSDIVDEPRPEQGDVIPTQRPADNVDLSQFFDMFMQIEQRLPNFDHMLMAMNDYAFQRALRQRQTNDFIGFCGLLKKGFVDWYTSSINNEINKVPNFIDLTNQLFDDDILKKIERKLVYNPNTNTYIRKTRKSTRTIANTDAGKSTNASANADAGESANRNANTYASEGTSTSANTDAGESTNTNANTNACKSTDMVVNTDAGESTNASANADAGESANTNANTDASEGTSTSANTDASESTVTSPNTDACKSTDMVVNIDDGESASASANANDDESTNTGTNSDACKSISNYSQTFVETTNGTITSRRIKTSICLYSDIAKNAKRLNKRISNKSCPVEDLPQSTGTDVDIEHIFDVIMPKMADYNTFLRKRLPIDRNTHLGNDYERHWWKQTNERIILNVDISDLVIDLIPNVKVDVTTFGFKIRIKHHNKWTIVLANKFEKPITKSKWFINKFMHIRLTVTKKEKELWNKCLVTETRELDTSTFKNHVCSKECNAPIIHQLKPSSTKRECMQNLATFLKHEYGMEELDTFMDERDSVIPPTTEENPQDSAINLKLSEDPSTEKSLNSDSEDPVNAKQSSMDVEVPPNVAE